MPMTREELLLESDDTLELWLRNNALLVDAYHPEKERDELAACTAHMRLIARELVRRKG